jgi:hypothetical protein
MPRKRPPKTLAAWLATRPPAVQALAREFPHRSQIVLDHPRFWVVGWTTDGNVLLSRVDPAVDYDAALQQQIEWPAALRRRELAPEVPYG